MDYLMKSLHLGRGLRSRILAVLLFTVLLIGSSASAADPAQPPPEGERPAMVGKPAQQSLNIDFMRLAETPTTLKVPAAVQGWADAMREDFEGTFPSAGWALDDADDATNGEYYPAKRNCVAYGGRSSAWLVGGGVDGTSLACGADYPDNADAWMVYGPFDLTNATDAKLEFELLLYSEFNYDWFYALAVLPNGDNWGMGFSGDSQGWVHRELYLTQLGPLGDLTGQSEVYIALGFTSDGSATYSGGAFVDDVVLRTFSGTRPVLFQDSFDDGDAAGWSVVEGSWSVRNGTYVGSGADARAVAGDSTWTDVIYEGRFMFDSSDAREASLLFRVQDAFAGENNGHYYQIANYTFFNSFWGGNVALHRIGDGTIDGLQVVTFNLSAGQWYNFRLELNGGTVKYYLDGAMVLSQSGLFDYSQGRIGIKAYYSTSHFDDIVVESSELGPSVDLQISAVEVTQAIQCLNNADCFGEHHRDWCSTENCGNTVPLLLDKPTWARVYLRSNMEEVGVTGLLYGFYEDGTNMPQSPLFYDPTGIIAYTDGGDRGSPNHTLNFRLPIEWTYQDRATLEARIFPTGVGFSPAVDAKRIEVAFRERNQLPVYSWRFQFPGGQVATETDVRAASAFMAKVYPLNSDAVDIRSQGVFTATTTTWQGLARELAHDCNDLRAALRDPGTKCYGWVPRGVNITSTDGETYYGWTQYGVSVGYIYRPPLPSGERNLAPQYIMAHEIGHTLPPVNHVATASCGGRGGGEFEREFPSTTGSIGEYGFWDHDVYVPEPTPSAQPTGYYDFMSYCEVDTNHQWVSPYTYKYLFDAIGTPIVALTEHLPKSSTQEYLVASGVASPDGAVTLYPFYHKTYPTGIFDSPENGPYSIELQDAQGQVLFTRFFGQTAAELPAEGAPVQFFEILPLPSDIDRILIKHNSTVLEEVSPSPNIPQVTVLAPSPGRVADNMLEITWAASDTDGDSLHYSVGYSADGGNTWRTIGVDLTDTTFVVSTDDLPGTGQAKVRVLASDGINTGVGESGTFTVTKKVPKVYILSPKDGTTIRSGQWLHLSGRAQDREDGLLRETTLVWTLDSISTIGTGRQLTLFGAPPGIHHIALTATDSDGNKGAASVSIAVIGQRIYLPITARGYQGE